MHINNTYSFQIQNTNVKEEKRNPDYNKNNDFMDMGRQGWGVDMRA